MNDSAPEPPAPSPPAAPKSGHAMREYRIYRVEKGGTDSLGEGETLVLVGTVEADDPDVALTQLAEEKKPPDGTIWRAYTQRYARERKLRKKVEERWIFD